MTSPVDRGASYGHERVIEGLRTLLQSGDPQERQQGRLELEKARYGVTLSMIEGRMVPAAEAAALGVALDALDTLAAVKVAKPRARPARTEPSPLDVLRKAKRHEPAPLRAPRFDGVPSTVRAWCERFGGVELQSAKASARLLIPADIELTDGAWSVGSLEHEKQFARLLCRQEKKEVRWILDRDWEDGRIRPRSMTRPEVLASLDDLIAFFLALPAAQRCDPRAWLRFFFGPKPASFYVALVEGELTMVLVDTDRRALLREIAVASRDEQVKRVRACAVQGGVASPLVKDVSSLPPLKGRKLQPTETAPFRLQAADLSEVHLGDYCVDSGEWLGPEQRAAEAALREP